MRVLVVEDEKKTAAFIRKALQAESFAVDVMHNGSDALLAAASTPFDAIVLDIMLPGRDGLSVLRQLRERSNRTPVLLLSARGEVNERVEGLNAGADDYLPKPFALAELVARVRALGRRVGETKSAVLTLADLSLDTVTRDASVVARSLNSPRANTGCWNFSCVRPGASVAAWRFWKKSGTTISIPARTWWTFTSNGCARKLTAASSRSCSTPCAAWVT